MSIRDLRAFIDLLRRAGDVVEVSAPVDPCLEAAEIHRRVIAAGGPALIFSNVKGADFPLVTNLFGTARRAELAFGERPLRLINRLVQLVETLMPPTPGKLWAARDIGLRAAQDRPQARQQWPGHRGRQPFGRRDPPGSTPCADDLAGGRRPVHHAAARLHANIRTGAVTTSGCTGFRSTTGRTPGMHWQIGKGGGFHYQVAEARGAGAAGDGLPRRSAGAHPVRRGSAAGERAGADARLAHRRREAGDGQRAPGRIRWSPTPSLR